MPKYSLTQVENWLKQSFNNNYGISKERAIQFFWSHPPYLLIRPQGENLTHANFPHYIDKACSMLGSNSYVNFIMILVNENATMGWINHQTRGGTPMQDLIADCQYMQGCLRSWYPVAQSDPYGGTPSMPWNAIQNCTKFYRSLPAGTVGRYYMPSTLAGNAWNWAPNWIYNHKYGDAYANCIDWIKSMGGNPWGASSGTGQQGDGGGLINLPRKVYLNNSKFEVLGVKFRRFKSWLYIDYPEGLNVAGGSSGSNGGTGGNHSGNVKKELEVFNSLGKRKFNYYMGRPQGNPNSTGWADCSGMVGWILHTAYPRVFNNGYLNTATILAYFKSKVIWHGTQSAFISSGAYKKCQAGDIIVFGYDPSCGAGGNSHTVFIYGDNGETISQEPPHTIYSNIHYLASSWWLPKRPYFYLIRT